MSDLKFHNLTIINGLGPVLANKLEALNISTTGDLLSLSASMIDSIATSVSGVSARAMRESFIPQARFCELTNALPEGPDALVDQGFLSYEDLLGARTGSVVNAFKNAGRDDFDEVAALKLQLEAARAAISFKAVVSVLGADADSDLVMGVAGAGFATGTHASYYYPDERGQILSPPLLRGKTHILVIRYQGQYHSVPVSARGTDWSRLTLNFPSTQSRAPERPGVPRFAAGNETIFREDYAKVSDVPNGTMFSVVSNDNSGKVRLVGRRSRLSGYARVIQTLVVASDRMPKNVQQGDVVVIDSGLLRAASTEEMTTLANESFRRALG